MKRHGFTLVELVAVMAALSIVMGIAVVLLIQVFDFKRSHFEYSDGRRTVNRLATDFRSDVHTYGKPEILMDNTVLLRWKTETAIVDYTLEPGRFSGQQNIIRLIQKRGSENQYETYRLPDRTTLYFTEGKDTDAGLVALSLWTTPLGTDKPKLDDLNPFDRTLPKSLEQRIDPKYAGNWRTIIARYVEEQVSQP